ncbi:MAG: LamG domain-containing protein [Caldilineaceae bacterium]|nr:LamG domain-containing protein [Caldilineaceae bacterium]
MAIVPIIPTQNVPQKPADPAAKTDVGLKMGFMFNEGAGTPKDLAGTITTAQAPQNGQWVDTPWGKGYHIAGFPILLGLLNVTPPITYHVLFKPDFPNSAAIKNALVFGETAMANNNPKNGIGFEWMGSADSSFAFFEYNESPVYSYVALQPVEHSWYTVSVTFDGTAAHFYINGEDTQENGTPAPSVSNQGVWMIGSSNFNGTIADARVYSRVLSANEIAAISSGPDMWVHYGAEPFHLEGHLWRRHTWQTGRGTVRIARRVTRVGRR